MVFDFVQASHRKQVERIWVFLRGRPSGAFHYVNSEPRDENLPRIHIWKSLQKVIAVVLRDGDAKIALREFEIEIACIPQQIRAVQRHAESYVQQACRGHADP